MRKKTKAAKSTKATKAAPHYSGTLYFNRGTTVPRADGTLWIELLARRLVQDKQAHATLCGHANLRESNRSAELMGFLRARRVAQILHAYGVPNEQMTVHSAGATVPIIDNGGAHLRPLTRRVDISLA